MTQPLPFQVQGRKDGIRHRYLKTGHEHLSLAKYSTQSNVGDKMILSGDLDHLPEAAFTYVGVIEEAIEKGEKLLKEQS